MDVAVKRGEETKAAVVPVTEIKKVGVIGAGQMGSGIAHVVALGGFEVLINDIRTETLDRAVGVIEIDDVLVATSAPGFRRGHRSAKILRLIPSSSVAASMTRSHSAS